jgi:hypothetical protein
MEWLFFITKPSFFSALNAPQSLTVLFVAPLPYVCIVLATLLVLLPFDIARARTQTPRGSTPGLSYALVPGCVLACAFLLMVDNFTYTMFGFGVVTVRSGLRVLYGGFILFLFAAVLRSVIRGLKSVEVGPRWSPLPYASGLVALSLTCTLFALVTHESIPRENVGEASAPSRPPDIFLISGDGLEADDLPSYANPISRTSHFGYLGPNAVVFENSFPNASRTAATTALALTGKYATTTKKTNTARFFSGDDAYQHLPALLRARGYRSIQIGVSHHVDSFYWGMKNAFDLHNRTEVAERYLDRLSDRLGGRLHWALHFSQVVFDRIAGRIRHSFGGKLMEQPHLVAKEKFDWIDGHVMVDQLLDFLKAHPGPVFAQLHSMATRFRPWEMAAPRLQAFDGMIERIVQYLKLTGRFENSIIVIWSDHGRQYTTERRLPFIMRFPEPAEIENPLWNTQTLDIAPTLLDYLGAPIPSWMEGRSLLRPIDRYEPIYTVKAAGKLPGIEPDGRILKGGMSDIAVIVCNRWYNLNLLDRDLQAGWIRGHTSPCPAAQLPGREQATEMLIRHLADRGYESALSWAVEKGAKSSRSSGRDAEGSNPGPAD